MTWVSSALSKCDAEAVLADGDADAEVDEQAGQPAAGGDPDGRDRDEQDEGADEQELVEVVDSQGPILPSRRRRRTMSPVTADSRLRYLT